MILYIILIPVALLPVALLVAWLIWAINTAGSDWGEFKIPIDPPDDAPTELPTTELPTTELPTTELPTGLGAAQVNEEHEAANRLRIHTRDAWQSNSRADLWRKDHHVPPPIGHVAPDAYAVASAATAEIADLENRHKAEFALLKSNSQALANLLETAEGEIYKLEGEIYAAHSQLNRRRVPSFARKKKGQDHRRTLSLWERVQLLANRKSR